MWKWHDWLPRCYWYPRDSSAENYAARTSGSERIPRWDPPCEPGTRQPNSKTTQQTRLAWSFLHVTVKPELKLRSAEIKAL